MDLVNQAVRHKTFGEGKICEWNGEFVSIRFGLEVKKFVFPDAFRNYLTMAEPKSKQYVAGILSEIDEATRLKQEEVLRDEEKQNLLRRLPLHKNAQAAFGFIENQKDAVRNSGTILSGTYRSGYHRGEPRTPARIAPNSACLLTDLAKSDVEENRIIWGVFMVQDDFIGAHCMDGVIPAHEKYRIMLNEEEQKKFLFWRYFDHEIDASEKKWGSVEVKCFSNATMAQILSDILALRHNTETAPLCAEFFDYFCKLNHLNKKQIHSTQ